MSINNRENRKKKLAKRKKFGVIKGGKPTGGPSLLERNDMTQKIDAHVVEAICRTLGRTDWEMDDEMFKRGFWQPYDTGEEVFLFDGKEKFLVGPWECRRIDGEWKHGRKIEWLFDRQEYKKYGHHTAEDERG